MTGRKPAETFIAKMTTEERDSNFEQIFKGHYQSLFSYALFMTEDAEQAKDTVNDVFERLWRVYASVRLDGIGNWLFMCVRNKCLDFLRRQQMARGFAQSKLEACDETISEWEEHDERLDTILALIGSMPPQTRFVMEQCYLQERTYKEVGELLGMSQSGVKKHIMKGLETIRNYFSVNYKKGQGPKTPVKRIENDDNR